MKSFPSEFATDQLPVTPDMLDRRGSVAVQKLNDRGYSLVAGLTRDYALELPVIGSDPAIREYCPKDATPKRFGTIESTEKWLAKGGGRAAYLLLNNEIVNNDGRNELVGYGWSGQEPDEEKMTGQPVTTAYRLAEAGRGIGLGKPFIQGVISATRALNTDKGIGLETWGSNSTAVRSYLDLNFVLRGTQAAVRPTLRPDTTDEQIAGGAPVIRGGMVSDTRLYMAYPSELFEQ